MTIEHERPEDELDHALASELLTVVALVFADSQGKPGTGSIPCPACRAAGRDGTIHYTISLRGPVGSKRALMARCSTLGCIRFLS